MKSYKKVANQRNIVLLYSSVSSANVRVKVIRSKILCFINVIYSSFRFEVVE